MKYEKNKINSYGKMLIEQLHINPEVQILPPINDQIASKLYQHISIDDDPKTDMSKTEEKKEETKNNEEKKEETKTE